MMVEPTGILDKHTGEIRNIVDMPNFIANQRCDYFNRESQRVCAKPATHWAICKSGILKVCDTHGVLGSDNYGVWIYATIDRDGLNIDDCSTIDMLLFYTCDGCGCNFQMSSLNASALDRITCDGCTEGSD